MKSPTLLNALWRRLTRTVSTEPRSMVMFQRQHRVFTEAELRDAAERAWGKRFDGVEDPMYFVSFDPVLTVVKAGPHIIRITFLPHRYSEEDEYALANLPREEQKRAWQEHHAVTLLDVFNDLSGSKTRIADRDAYASLARLV